VFNVVHTTAIELVTYFRYSALYKCTYYYYYYNKVKIESYESRRTLAAFQDMLDFMHEHIFCSQ